MYDNNLQLNNLYAMTKSTEFLLYPQYKNNYKFTALNLIIIISSSKMHKIINNENPLNVLEDHCGTVFNCL